MANRTLHTRDILRQFRVFKLHYLCDACPNEWSTEMMVIAHDWCPCCDAKCEPYDQEALLEDAADEEDE